jgi:hypothetical protein
MATEIPFEKDSSVLSTKAEWRWYHMSYDLHGDTLREIIFTFPFKYYRL